MPFTPALAALVPVLALIALTPDPIAFQLGPDPGLLVRRSATPSASPLAYLVMVRLRGAPARTRRTSSATGSSSSRSRRSSAAGCTTSSTSGSLYKDDPIKIFLPPYTGPRRLRRDHHRHDRRLSSYARYRWHQSFCAWADIIAPGPVRDAGHRRAGATSSTRSCTGRRRPAVGHPDRLRPPDRRRYLVHRAAPTRHDRASTRCSCTSRSQRRHRRGRAALARLARFGSRLRPGDLLLIFFIWYGAVRFALETLRVDNWTFFGRPDGAGRLDRRHRRRR